MPRPIGSTDGPRQPIDRLCKDTGLTYHEMVQEVDDGAFDLSGFELDFISDAVDNPARFRSDRQLETIESIYRKHVLGERD